jgi:hypothetical protein
MGPPDRHPEDGGAAERRQVAGGRCDLLAEEAGITFGTSRDEGPEYRTQAEAIAELCRLAGADENLIPQWTEEGRRRAQAARLHPFSQPGRSPRRSLPPDPRRGYRANCDER